MNHQPSLDKIILYVRVPYESKYQYPIKKREESFLKHSNEAKTFIKYWKDMEYVYKNIEKYNPGKKRKSW